MKLIKKFWPMLFILLLIAFFSYPYWLKGLVPFPSDYLVTFFAPWQYFFGMPVKNGAMPDVVTQMYPWKHLVVGMWTSGLVPLWDPYVFSGTPLLANYQSAVFHPLNFLFFILPQSDAWSIMILLQPLLAGLFTYLFARQIGLSRSASLIAGMSFMFCGFMTAWMAYGTLSYALLWLPLILFAVEKVFSKRSSFLILISFSAVASLFSGHFQTSLYILGATLLYLVFKFITTRQLKAFLYCLLSVFLGVMLSSVQLLPTFELYGLSVRSSHLNISEIIPWRYLITLFSPDFFGNPVTRNDWYGHYAEWSGFIGTISLILVIYAIFTKGKRPQAVFFAVLGIFSLVLTRPTPLLGLITSLKIPIFSSSAASRALSLFSFSASILAGYGWEKLKKDFKEKRMRQPLTFFSFFLLILVGVWAKILFLKPFGADKIEIAKRNLILPTGLAVGLWGVVFVYSIASKILKRKTTVEVLRSVLLTLIVLAIAFDVFRFARKWLSFSETKFLYPRLGVTDYLVKNSGSDRVFGYYSMAMQNYFGIQGFDGYDPLYSQRYGELLLAATEGKIGTPSTRGVGLERRGKYTLPLLNLLGGKYLLHAIPDDHFSWVFPFWDYPKQFKLLYEDEKYQVYDNLEAFPRAFIVYDYEVENQPQKIIDKMLLNGDKLRQVAIVEEEISLEKSKKPVKEETEIIDYSANKVVIGTKSDFPGLLVLSDNYYPGWRAFVNGSETKILRADYTLRAVVLPEGQNRVEFIYQPESFRVGRLASIISLGGIVILAALIKMKKI